MAKKKNSALKMVLIISSILLVLIIALYFVFKNSDSGLINVQTTKVSDRTISQIVSAVGTIEPETEIKISSQTSGEIIMLGVKEGDTVKPNQLLSRINPDIVESQLDQYKAMSEASKMEIEASKTEKERAKLDFDRSKELYEKGFLSKAEFDRSKSTYETSISSYKASLSRFEQSQASLKQMQKSLARTALYAPISGVVTALNVEKGEKVVGTEMMAGTEMMRISDLSVMNAVVDVDENDIVLVKIGDTATVEIDALPGKLYKALVIEIGHSAKVNALGTQDQVVNFSVKLRLVDDEARLRPGMSCNVEIMTETKHNVLAVPLQSVTIRDDKKKDDKDNKEDNAKVEETKVKRTDKAQSVVFVKNGDKAKMVKVETGISDDGYIEIMSGLKNGDEVVSGTFEAISKLLMDGSKIKVSELKYGLKSK